MKQRLLFNRIHVEGAWGAINQRVKRALAVDAVAAMAVSGSALPSTSCCRSVSEFRILTCNIATPRKNIFTPTVSRSPSCPSPLKRGITVELRNRVTMP
jgi:hypothetical protein